MPSNPIGGQLHVQTPIVSSTRPKAMKMRSMGWALAQNIVKRKHRISHTGIPITDEQHRTYPILPRRQSILTGGGFLCRCHDTIIIIIIATTASAGARTECVACWNKTQRSSKKSYCKESSRCCRPISVRYHDCHAMPTVTAEDA